MVPGGVYASGSQCVDVMSIERETLTIVEQETWNTRLDLCLAGIDVDTIRFTPREYQNYHIDDNSGRATSDTSWN